MADTAEFDRFVVARSQALLRTAYLLVRDEALAEDLLQTALTKAWFAWGRIEGEPERYVRRILVNTSASWWRRRWHRERPTADLPERRTPDRATRAATGTSGTRSGGCRRGSARWSCCGTSRTAPRPRPRDLMGCSVGTVKSQCSKALAKLRIDASLVVVDERSQP